MVAGLDFLADGPLLYALAMTNQPISQMSGWQPYFEPLIDDPTSVALSARGLTKRFGELVAVDRLTMDVPKGSIYGLVGPNGAGKTTAISMWTGLTRPDAGDVWLDGHDVWRDPQAAKASLGLLVDGLPVFDRLSGSELLYYLGAIRGLEQETVKARSGELLEALGLSDAADKRIVDYSAGMTKKILLAAALLHNPAVLILDEPLEAVDPASGRIIQQILRSYAASGGTVILSSHVMEIVEGLCDHVAIIGRGQVLTCGPTESVRQNHSLTDVFINLVGGGQLGEGSLGWLGTK